MQRSTNVVSPGTRQQARTVVPHTHNRRILSFALVPLALLCANSLFAWAHRSLSLVWAPGGFTETKVRRVASESVHATYRLPVLSMESVQHGVYSHGGKLTAQEWEVLCRTPEGDYQIRIDGDSQRVYAVNQLKEYGERESVGGTLSPQQAELQARRYARVVGVSPHSLRLDHAARTWRNTWDFTYHRRIPGYGIRSLKITLNQEGGLESVWNPMRML